MSTKPTGMRMPLGCCKAHSATKRELLQFKLVTSMEMNWDGLLGVFVFGNMVPSKSMIRLPSWSVKNSGGPKTLGPDKVRSRL